MDTQNNNWPQPTAAESSPAPPPPPGPRKGKLNGKVIAGGAALLLIGIGIGTSSNPESKKTQQPVSVNGSTQQGSVESTTTTAPAATSTTMTEPPTTTTTAAPTTTTTALPAQAVKIRVPNVVGKDLQTAQDTMQAAGLWYLTSHDSTGLNRMQILDRNWLVTDQSPAAGSMVEADRLIDLGARKFTD